ncbi:WD40 repeat-like protein [Rickenella mellea]|uniref:WD40 repeat-like protein n=1 Tax=Rickenella mellea TaxID=50990 RepID=A0A4V3AZL7_9AGAM|nr:WD40 repeat-like protein [Rickenella mellea]
MQGTLTNPFNNIAYPTAVQTSLPSGASFARYDPSGRYIAGGRPDGTAVVWELDTKASIRWLEGHVKAVTSVDWSQNSRFVLTSSKDWNVIVWDMASECDPSQRRTTVRFDAPVLTASFHPQNMQIILVLLSTGEAHLVDLRKHHRGRYELTEVVDESDEDSSRQRSAMTVAKFDPSGRYIFVGNSQGYVLVFHTRTRQMIARHKISGAGIMRGLAFAKLGRRLLTNSSDRILRQFNLPTYPSPTVDADILDQELEPTYRFSDPINKVAWNNMAYSPDGEWLAGGAADQATHKIYIWDISSDGQFATALDGGREPLLDVHWHPKAPAIISTTNSGDILLWHCPTPERWGAFAGGFEEVDENVEYEEREDEFDIEDEEELAERKKKEEDVEVDVADFGDQNAEEVIRNGKDEDLLWAEEDPDDDAVGWKMKLIMEPDE